MVPKRPPILIVHGPKLTSVFVLLGVLLLTSFMAIFN